MRKTIIGLMCAAVISAMAMPAFAEVTPVLVEPGTATQDLVTSPEIISSQEYSIEINGAALDLGDKKIMKEDDTIIVPLRIISESLGFVITWDAEKQAIHMDDGNVKIDLRVGEDLYVVTSSKAIGMAAPQSLGVAPRIINENTYVPVDLYKLLYSNPDAVQISDNIISISSKASESADDAVQVPNPLVVYNSVDEARAAMNWQFAVPSSIPEGYGIKDVIVIGNSLAEVNYIHNDKEMVYRTQKGEKDISGDYTVYKTVETVTVDEVDVTVKGADADIGLATWCKDGISYSLQFGEAIDMETLTAVIQDIK